MHEPKSGADDVQRLNAEHDLLKHHMKALVEHGDFVLFALDREGAVTLAEGGGLRWLGLRPGEAVGRSAYELFAHSAGLLADISRALTGAAFVSVRHVVESDQVWEIHWGPVRCPGGTLQGVTGLASNVTERKRTEDALRAEEARYRLLAENATEMILLVGRDGCIRYASPACRAMLGYEPEALVGRPVLALYAPEEREAVLENLQRMRQGLDTAAHLTRRQFLGADGRRRWLETSFRGIFDPETGELAEVQTASRDVTPQVHAERLLLETRTRLSQVMAASPIVLYSSPLEGAEPASTWVSDSITRLLGYDPDEAAAPGWWVDCLHPEDRPLALANQAALRAEGQLVHTYRLRHKNGTYRWIRDEVRLDRVGGAWMMVGACLDITESMQAEIELQLAYSELSRLNQLKDEFLSTVSHELRTPLVAIQNAASILEKRRAGELTSHQERFVEVILEQGRRLSELVDDILDSQKLEAGLMAYQLREGDVAEVLREVAGGFRHVLDARGIAFTLAIGEEALHARFDRVRLGQVLLNLLSNAAKFTPPGGAVTLSAGRTGGEVRFAVADSGIGIDEADQAHLFSKFYQVGGGLTSRPGGTGLGLTICKQMVESGHGGRIWLESALGEGSTFHVALPALG